MDNSFSYITLLFQEILFPTLLDVYFDDVTITHTPSPIVSTNDYFPFGLQINSDERENSTEQKYLFGSKELQDELSLNWYDFGARMYQAEIGRWLMADPLADAKPDMTPYRYSFNDPVNVTDPTGLFEYVRGAYGEQIEVGWLAGGSSIDEGDVFKNTLKDEKARNAWNGPSATSSPSSSFVNRANTWMKDFQKKNNEIFGTGKNVEQVQQAFPSFTDLWNNYAGNDALGQGMTEINLKVKG